MQEQIHSNAKIIIKTLNDVQHIRRLLKAGLQEQAFIKLASMEISLLDVCTDVEEIEPSLPIFTVCRSHTA